MGITNEEIKRINELYHKMKKEGLKEKEKEEQAFLRKKYIDSFKQNLRGQLETITIKEKDGTFTKVKDKRKVRD